jgi:hypothetical protein
MGGEMAEERETTHTDEAFEVNPDGADLDGTAEIERQHGEPQTGSGGSVQHPSQSQNPAGVPGQPDQERSERRSD